MSLLGMVAKRPLGKSIGSLGVLVLLLLLSVAGGSWNPLTQLTFNLTDEDQPSLSSSGNKIAFISNLTTGPELFIMDSDGANLRQLTSNRARECCPSISGNGSIIVFQSDLRGDEEVFLITSDGAIPVFCPPGSALSGTGCQLTDNRDDDVSPVLSADGSKVAFVSNRDGDPEIFIMKSDGSGLGQLTFNTADDGNPSISRDGSLVAFDSNVGVDHEIFLVRSDGTGLRQVTDNMSSEDRFPSISLDGSRIVYTSSGPAIASSNPITSQGPNTFPGHVTVQPRVVMIVNGDGSGLRVLTSNSADNFDARLSGDGRVVAFVSTLDGDRDIYKIFSDGSGLTQVTDDPAIETQPSLNFEGTLLVYASNREGEFEIYVTCFLDGDVNHDGVINILDLTRVGTAIGSGLGESRYDRDADVNRDGVVNILDLILVATNFGASC